MTTNEPQDSPTTITTPTPAPVRRLARRKNDRILGGVCGGIADYFGIDVALVRVLAVVVTLFTVVAPAFYVAAWLLIPEAGADRSPLERQFGR